MQDHPQSALQEAFFIALPTAENITLLPNGTLATSTLDRWFRLSYLPNQPVPRTCGRSGEDWQTGIFQIDVMERTGKGDNTSRNAELSLRSYFTAGRAIPYVSGVVKISRCGRSGGGFLDGDFWVSPISIVFETQIPR